MLQNNLKQILNSHFEQPHHSVREKQNLESRKCILVRNKLDTASDDQDVMIKPHK